MWTTKQLSDKQISGKIKGFTVQGVAKHDIPKSKYGNKKTIVDNIAFDSAKEAKRFSELKILLKAGEIGFLELQKEYELNTGGTHSLKYIADFVYIDSKTGQTIIEDVKGYLTSVYKKKRRLMLKVHGIKITEK